MGYGGRPQFLRHRSVAPNAGGVDRFRSPQWRLDPVEYRRRPAVAGRFGLFRYATAQFPAWSGAHHGQRRAATGLSADRDRRRTLLGRRRALQCAARSRSTPSAIRACWCSRSTSSVRGARCRATCSTFMSATRTSFTPRARARTPAPSARHRSCGNRWNGCSPISCGVFACRASGLAKLPPAKQRDADVVEIVRKLQTSETLKLSPSMSVVHLI
jgi:hypothetical protein